MEITELPVANSIDPDNDTFPIVTANVNTTQQISRATFLGLASAPVGLTDSQTLTNKTLTSPTISGPVLSGTITGTYTIGGTPTFPSSVVTLTGTQTLTNKTLTSPTINSPTITNATISADTVTGYTTSNAGTIYGVAVSGGQLTGANTVTNTALATGIDSSKLYNPYKFSVHLSANKTVTASSWNKIAFDSKAFDTSSNFDSTTNYQFTAPVAGFYFFEVSICGNGVATTGSLSAGINVNTFSSSPTYQGASAIPGSTGNIIVHFGRLIQLSANDTVQFYAFTSVTQLNAGAFPPTLTCASGYLVSAT